MMRIDLDPKIMEDYRHRNYWLKCKDVIQVTLNSLTKLKVFRPIFLIIEDVKLVGYKQVLIRNGNEKNEIERYKANLGA